MELLSYKLALVKTLIHRVYLLYMDLLSYKLALVKTLIHRVYYTWTYFHINWL